MSKTITAQFDSVDMATVAANHIRQRVKGVTGIKIAYQPPENHHENSVFSDFFLPVGLQSGVNLQESISFPVNYTAVLNRQQEYSHTETNHVRLEIQTNNVDTRNIKSNLRTYGGLNLKEHVNQK